MFTHRPTTFLKKDDRKAKFYRCSQVARVIEEKGQGTRYVICLTPSPCRHCSNDGKNMPDPPTPLPQSTEIVLQEDVSSYKSKCSQPGPNGRVHHQHGSSPTTTTTTTLPTKNTVCTYVGSDGTLHTVRLISLLPLQRCVYYFATVIRHHLHSHTEPGNHDRQC